MELPYQDGRFSMYVILPVTRNTLSQVEDSLSFDILNGHLGGMRSVRVELHLPRFKSESKFSLKVSCEPLRLREMPLRSKSCLVRASSVSPSGAAAAAEAAAAVVVVIVVVVAVVIVGVVSFVVVL